MQIHIGCLCVKEGTFHANLYVPAGHYVYNIFVPLVSFDSNVRMWERFWPLLLWNSNI